MSKNIKLYGFIISSVPGEGGYEFEFSDIYLKQKTRPIKEDSFDFSKLHSNMEFLKAAKNFLFYTKSENGSRYTSLGIRFLKDWVENQVSGQKTFTLKIVAVMGDSSIIAHCSGCELAQSMMMPTPIGTIQCYQVKCSDISIEKLAGASISR